MSAGILILALAATATGSPGTDSAGPRFVTIGEAFSSASSEVGIRGAWRLFTAPGLSELCPTIPRPFALRVSDQPIVLHLHQRFAYDALTVLAVDEKDSVIADVPLQILVEEVDPPVLELGAEILADGHLLPIRRGHFRFRFATLCAGPEFSATADAEVRDQ